MESNALISASNYIQKRPFTMLKDYLLDDLSSCSSSGFKSFPRRQCCSTVRLLLEIDLNSGNPKPPRHRPQFKRSISSPSAAKSALQKASRAFANAVKLLPFPSSSSARNRSSKGILRRLPRSISRKLFKNRKADQREIGENRERKLFGEFLEEKEKPPQGEIFAAGSFTSSGDSTISSTSKSYSWTESEFTGQSSFSESCRSRNGDGVGEKDAVSGGEEKTGDGACKTVGDSVENAKEWANEEEKEQLSPVSVLDCPFQDDEEEEEDINPPFQRSLLCIEGSKQKCVSKMRKLENTSGIKAVNLEQQIDQMTEAEDDHDTINSITKHMKDEKDANELLKLVKAKLPLKNHLLTKADSLLLDFFKEKIAENNGTRSEIQKEIGLQFDEELEAANKWLKGEAEEMFLGWEVKDKRHIYVREMERNGKWRNFDEDKQELAIELELQIFTCLVNEALLDLQS